MAIRLYLRTERSSIVIDKIWKSVVCTCVAVASVAGLHAESTVVPIGHAVGRVSYATNEAPLIVNFFNRANASKEGGK